MAGIIVWIIYNIRHYHL